MFLLNNIYHRKGMYRRLKLHIYGSDTLYRYILSRNESIEPEGSENYLIIIQALFHGLKHCIVYTDRLGFLFTMFSIRENTRFITRMLIRRGIVVFADLVLQRLTIRSRRHQGPDIAYNELCQLSQSWWGIFFDAFEPNIRREWLY